jgi:hypothetical protein
VCGVVAALDVISALYVSSMIVLRVSVTDY